MELFTSEGISHIASSMDKATEMRKRLSFSCVCVEVEQSAILPSTIQVTIEDFGYFEVKVEYPWRPRVCSLCKQAGHIARYYKNMKEVWKPIAKDADVPKTREEKGVTSVSLSNAASVEMASSDTPVGSDEATPDGAESSHDTTKAAAVSSIRKKLMKLSLSIHLMQQNLQLMVLKVILKPKKPSLPILKLKLNLPTPYQSCLIMLMIVTERMFPLSGLENLLPRLLSP